MEPKFKKVTPDLMVHDVGRAVAFYTEKGSFVSRVEGML